MPWRRPAFFALRGLLLSPLTYEAPVLDQVLVLVLAVVSTTFTTTMFLDDRLPHSCQYDLTGPNRERAQQQQNQQQRLQQQQQPPALSALAP